jgi:hypothetical protein
MKPSRCDMAVPLPIPMGHKYRANTIPEMLAFYLRTYSSKAIICVSRFDHLEYITTYRQEAKGFLPCTCRYRDEPLANLYGHAYVSGSINGSSQSPPFKMSCIVETSLFPIATIALLHSIKVCEHVLKATRPNSPNVIRLNHEPSGFSSLAGD